VFDGLACAPEGAVLIYFGSVLDHTTDVVASVLAANEPVQWPFEAQSTEAIVTNADAVTYGLVALAVLGIVLAALRARRGRTVRPYVIPIFAALALSVSWASIASQLSLDGRPSGVRPSGAEAAAHEHDEDLEESSVLISSEAFAEHLVHLRSVDFAVTATQQDESTLLRGSTRQATSRYREVVSATSEGYVDLAGDDREREILYLYDRSFIKEGTWIDPGRPQALIYLRMPDAAYLLVGAAFITPFGDGPHIGGGLTIWFPHRDLCVDDQEEIIAKSIPGRGCPSGSRSLAWKIEALHVWLFENPNGPFAGRLTYEAAEAARRRGNGERVGVTGACLARWRQGCPTGASG
jgi:hypothetical protein